MRPHQWVKNLFVLVPLVFAKELLHPATVVRALVAFAAFCLGASAVYVLNDLIDVEADRAHPVKRSRPIASGAVSVSAAKGLFAGLVLTALAAALAVSPAVAGVVAAYLALNVAYTFGLKRVAYLDVLCIALGFLLRVAAGTVAVRVHASQYLLVVTFVLACFLGFGKRMHELRQGANASKQRAVLARYDERVLAICLHVTGAATVVLYVLYTLDRHTQQLFGTRWLVLTTGFTVFGVYRFLRLVRYHAEAESPTEEMLRDKPFLANLALWGIAVVAIIYAS